jgi:hypothetical protein
VDVRLRVVLISATDGWVWLDSRLDPLLAENSSSGGSVEIVGILVPENFPYWRFYRHSKEFTLVKIPPMEVL